MFLHLTNATAYRLGLSFSPSPSATQVHADRGMLLLHTTHTYIRKFTHERILSNQLFYTLHMPCAHVYKTHTHTHTLTHTSSGGTKSHYIRMVDIIDFCQLLYLSHILLKQKRNEITYVSDFKPSC